MKKKILSLLLASAMVFSLAACGEKKEESKVENAKGKVGVAMPTQSSESWIND